MNEHKKTIEVVAAIIFNDGKLFAAKRKAKPVNKPLPAEAGFPESGDNDILMIFEQILEYNSIDK